jgi:hypothetical protein
MKALLAGLAVAFLLVPSLVRSGFAQDIDPRCKDVYDKVACGCALQNGGRVIPPSVGVKREGLKLRPREGSTQTLDGGQVAFPKYFRRDGFKVHKSRALEGYLACMRASGRK